MDATRRGFLGAIVGGSLWHGHHPLPLLAAQLSDGGGDPVAVESLVDAENAEAQALAAVSAEVESLAESGPGVNPIELAVAIQELAEAVAVRVAIERSRPRLQ